MTPGRLLRKAEFVVGCRLGKVDLRTVLLSRARERTPMARATLEMSPFLVKSGRRGLAVVLLNQTVCASNLSSSQPWSSSRRLRSSARRGALSGNGGRAAKRGEVAAAGTRAATAVVGGAAARRVAAGGVAARRAQGNGNGRGAARAAGGRTAVGRPAGEFAAARLSNNSGRRQHPERANSVSRHQPVSRRPPDATTERHSTRHNASDSIKGRGSGRAASRCGSPRPVALLRIRAQ